MNAGVKRRPIKRASARWLTAMAVLFGTFGGPIGLTEWADGTASPLTRSASAREAETTAMKIRMTIDGKTAIAILDDTPTARDFATLLPLTITLADYAATEKISDLPRRLSQDSAPPGYTPVAGDIAYYAPWGNLAIFYHGAKYARGLIRLGVIETGVNALEQSDGFKMTMDLIIP